MAVSKPAAVTSFPFRSPNATRTRCFSPGSLRAQTPVSGNGSGANVVPGDHRALPTGFAEARVIGARPSRRSCAPAPLALSRTSRATASPAERRACAGTSIVGGLTAGGADELRVGRSSPTGTVPARAAGSRRPRPLFRRHACLTARPSRASPPSQCPPLIICFVFYSARTARARASAATKRAPANAAPSTGSLTRASTACARSARRASSAARTNARTGLLAVTDRQVRGPPFCIVSPTI